MNEGRWTNSETLKFVQKYVELDCLWDPTKPQYRLKKARTRALEKLVEVMQSTRQMSVTDVKNKIRSLRTTYFGEVQKIKRMASDDLETDYKPSMKWFYVLKPIMEQIMHRRDEENSEPRVMLEELNPESDMKCEYLEEDQEYFENSSTTSTSAPEIPTSTQYQNHSRPVRKRRKSITNDSADEAEVFSQYVKIQLQQLDVESRLVVQNEILNLLNQARLRIVRRAQEENPNKLDPIGLGASIS